MYAQNFLAGILDCNIHEPHIWLCVKCSGALFFDFGASEERKGAADERNGTSKGTKRNFDEGET